MLFELCFVVGWQYLSVSAQVAFIQPIAGQVVNREYNSAAVGVFISLAMHTTTSSTAGSRITAPPALSKYAALVAKANSSPSSDPSLSSTSPSQSATATPSSGVEGLGSAISTTSSNSNGETAKMTYMLVIAGITLATAIILFWIWARYRRSRPLLPISDSLPDPVADDPPRCVHESSECECSRLRKMYDGVVTEFNILRLGSIRSRSSNSITGAEKGLATQGARPGTSGSMNQLASSGSGESPSPALDYDAQRKRFEDEYRRRRASRASQRSQKTILAELEGDLAPYAIECEDVVPPLPFSTLHPLISQVEGEEYESILKTRNKTFVVKRKTMVGEGKTAVFVKGKLAATIVAVRSKPLLSDGGVTKMRIEEGSDLDFCDERFMTYDGSEDEGEGEERSTRNGGELERGAEEEEIVEDKELDLEDFEAAIIEAMKQTRLDDLRRERRRKKRSHLAKGGGSRDLGIVEPMPSK